MIILSLPQEHELRIYFDWMIADCIDDQAEQNPLRTYYDRPDQMLISELEDADVDNLQGLKHQLT
ncbi:hypothetical protein D918_04973 [Trichuris suis]|nr:hypothetical protein D918_04973 [Trichuris suis]